MSPKASTIRCAADSLVKKCWPILGLRDLVETAASFVTLTLFLPGI
jgi:hypothetical protein